MSEMIERVARAICANDPENYEWEWLTEGGKAHFFESARAAIEAMRDPTDEMRRVGRDKFAEEEGGPMSVYATMIDAAIK